MYLYVHIFQIPNPLFDLAGITCGHFLVPFWTFFGATLIGKAVIKMHIQKMFVIIAFNESLLARAVGLLAYLPVVGLKLEQPFKTFLEKQRKKFHRKPGTGSSGQVSFGLMKSLITLLTNPGSHYRFLGCYIYKIKENYCMLPIMYLPQCVKISNSS